MKGLHVVGLKHVPAAGGQKDQYVFKGQLPAPPGRLHAVHTLHENVQKDQVKPPYSLQQLLSAVEPLDTAGDPHLLHTGADLGRYADTFQKFIIANRD